MVDEIISYNGIYNDMISVLGEEITKKVHHFYRGQQVTFPMRLYSKEYTQAYLVKYYTGCNLKELSRNLGYSERWVKALIDRYDILTIQEEVREKKEA